MAAAINAAFGLIVAWVLVRYDFPGRRIVDSLIDLPFALPTAVAGIALTALYAGNGWLGQFLEPLGVKVAFTPLGIVVALIFIGLPFVVRTVEPVLQDLDAEDRGGRGDAWRPPLAGLLPRDPADDHAALWLRAPFARGLGEYGSVIFIAGNMPMVSEIVPLLIVIELNVRLRRGHRGRHRYAGGIVLPAARDQPAAALDARPRA